MNKIDMSMPPEQFLLNIINQTYGKNFTFEEFYFGKRYDTTLHGCESVIYMHAQPSGPYTGSFRVYYNRVQLDDFLEGRFLTVPWREFFDTDDMLSEVQEQLGINLPRDNMISDIVDTDNEATKIRVSSRSIVYKGYIPVFFMGNPRALINRVKLRELNGFQVIK